MLPPVAFFFPAENLLVDKYHSDNIDDAGLTVH